MKKILLFLFLFVIIGFFILPNLFNGREKTSFTANNRLLKAKETYESRDNQDSITLAVSNFYKRGELTKFLFGEEYRALWSLPVKFPVWRNDTATIGEVGGGEQTTSVDIKSTTGENYTLRSVAKDQSRALPPWLQMTLARPVFRDQASSLNPYAAPVVSRLADKAGLLHTNPVLYYVSFDPAAGEAINQLLAGRVMLLEEEPDESWNGTSRFGSGVKILETDEMFERRGRNELWVDSLEFARCRLFDIVIGDWDRHANQWEWAWDTSTGKCRPIPVDRDMAFYDFRGGLIDRLALQLVPKFQSFEEDYEYLEGYMVNGKELNYRLLRHLTPEQWKTQAAVLQNSLTLPVIEKAFRKYPPEVYEIYGPVHARILKERLTKLDQVTHFFIDWFQQNSALSDQ